MRRSKGLFKSAKYYVLAVAVFICLDAVFLLQLFNQQRSENIEAQNHLLSVTKQSVLHGFANNAELIFDNVLDTPLYQNLMWEANWADDTRKQQIRDQIFNSLYPLYNSMDKFKLKQLHFHLHNNESFLRFHRPNKFGDDLTHVRSTVAFTNQTGLAIQGFEEGRIFNGFRFVFPLFWNKEPAGSVETSVSMKVIMNAIARELGGNVSFIIRRDIVESKVFKNEMGNYEVTPFSTDFMYEASLMHLNTRMLFTQLLSKWNRSESLKESVVRADPETRMIDAEGNSYMVTLLPVNNAVSDKTIGFLVFYQRDDENKYLIGQYLLIFVFTSLVAVIVVLLLYRSRSNELALADSQAMLSQNVERFEKAQKIVNLGTWEFDSSSQTLYWSDEVFRIFGETPQSFNPSYERLLSYVHPEDREELDYAFHSSLANGSPYQVKHRIFRSDGSMLYVEEECEHEMDENGIVVRSFGTIHDITDIVERENRLEYLGNRYQSLIERLPNLVYRFDWGKEDRWKIQFANASARFFTGYYAYELLAKKVRLLDMIHPQDLERVQQHIYSALEADKPYEIEYRLRRLDGTEIYVSDRGRKIIGEQDDWQVEGVITDITSQRKALAKLQKFIDTQKNIVILTDGYVLAFANSAYFNFFGLDREAEGSENHRCICDFFQPGEHFFDLSKLTLEDRHWVDAILRYPPSERNVAMKDAKGGLATFSVEVNHFDDRHFVVSFSDISDTFTEKLMWRQKASMDALTGAYNRYFFELSIGSFMNLVHRNKRRVGLIMMDIDHFKKINDKFGHGKGDEVLRDLSALIRSSLRESDLLIRWGGEEFLIVLSVDGESGLEQVANGIRGAVNEYQSSTGPVTCSFGGTLVVNEAEIDKAIQRADAGLYYVKLHGRNNYHYVPPGHS
ncbi:diguanylate cyclase [Thiomicrorhabdus xiamenensis]|uniref:Diguanylate cyclase n=1 Tax=Thiomicrorhabdus xiamenensis TaxID=2739063 RepID=A0A7D4NSP3_9GAMM|nr:diguanylate cyclase [Thiomicrorhabdus xiamenensis]QKI90117.1 diguanylate cyclase [Thiomicrorhabdus xiamenensis]